MTYCNICNMIVINVAWYIEQTVSGIEKTVEDCMKHTPNFEKKHYTFVNGKIKEEKIILLMKMIGKMVGVKFSMIRPMKRIF